MPYFAQEPLSYLTLPTIRNAYKTFSIKVTFRPDNVDGEFRIHCCSDFPCSILTVFPFFCYLLCLSCLHMVNVPASRVLPSVPHLSWWEGLVLYAGESQELRCEVGRETVP